MFDTGANQLLLKQAVKWGVTYWDTADCYSWGKSEKGIGKYFSRYPEDRQKALATISSSAGATTKKKTPARTTSPGRERMVLVIDRSGSMGLSDYRPSRLKAAVEAAEEMIQIKMKRDPRDEVGIVWFRGRGRMCHPLVALASGKAGLLQKLKTIIHPKV